MQGTWTYNRVPGKVKKGPENWREGCSPKSGERWVSNPTSSLKSPSVLDFRVRVLEMCQKMQLETIETLSKPASLPIMSPDRASWGNGLKMAQWFRRSRTRLQGTVTKIPVLSRLLYLHIVS
jgi:hypothetical protein